MQPTRTFRERWLAAHLSSFADDTLDQSMTRDTLGAHLPTHRPLSGTHCRRGRNAGHSWRGQRRPNCLDRCRHSTPATTPLRWSASRPMSMQTPASPESSDLAGPKTNPLATHCYYHGRFRHRGRVPQGARVYRGGSTAGPSSFVRDFFGNGCSCPWGARGVYRGVGAPSQVIGR